MTAFERVAAADITPGRTVFLVWKALSGRWAPASIPDPLHGGPHTVVAAAADTRPAASGKGRQKIHRLTVRAVDPATGAATGEPFTLDTEPTALFLTTTPHSATNV